MLDCLYEDFPGLRAVVGDKRFHDLSVAYLTKYPSRTYSLRDLGDRLEKFLTKERRWISAHHDLALEVVRLEWAHIVAFDSEEFPPVDIDALLGGGDPAKLRLGLQPYLSFLACEYPIDNFMVSVRRREQPQGEASNAVAERTPRKIVKKFKLPTPEKNFLVVHRNDYSVWYKRLDPEAFLILTALKKGLSLQVACERAFRRRKDDPTFPATLRTWFTQWASFGWFLSRGIKVPGPASYEYG